MERLSVTQAVRQFSDLMNRVFYQRSIIELERGNKVIARIYPAAQESPLKVKDLNDFFHNLPSLGDDSERFAEDLTEIRKQVPTERNPWD
ncbi:MAG: antitoxin [Candidatus Electrothrix sp. AW2]|nr:antitoxin [Candidatus Electrothrix sp. AX1]MCI5134260.1 antitoxin [Candidatus Electrothrix gigas]MCI5182530.1 antitoxin [Candidatus Electrothrix gigas]